MFPGNIETFSEFFCWISSSFFFNNLSTTSPRISFKDSSKHHQRILSICFFTNFFSNFFTGVFFIKFFSRNFSRFLLEKLTWNSYFIDWFHRKILILFLKKNKPKNISGICQGLFQKSIKSYKMFCKYSRITGILSEKLPRILSKICSRLVFKNIKVILQIFFRKPSMNFFRNHFRKSFMKYSKNVFLNSITKGLEK